jgi:MYXO-CTERM domain-containing protein
VRFWGENDTTSSPGGSFAQQRLDPSLLPSDRSRFFSVRAKPAWPVGMVKMTVHVIYPGRTEATTKELTFSKQVLVVSPVVPGGAAALLAAVVLLWFTRRQRRRSRFAPELAGS